jgi:hypothetical protein
VLMRSINIVSSLLGNCQQQLSVCVVEKYTPKCLFLKLLPPCQSTSFNLVFATLLAYRDKKVVGVFVLFVRHFAVLNLIIATCKASVPLAHG